jgi:hypothetical protein
MPVYDVGEAGKDGMVGTEGMEIDICHIMFVMVEE